MVSNDHAQEKGREDNAGTEIPLKEYVHDYKFNLYSHVPMDWRRWR